MLSINELLNVMQMYQKLILPAGRKSKCMKLIAFFIPGTHGTLTATHVLIKHVVRRHWEIIPVSMGVIIIMD